MASIAKDMLAAAQRLADDVRPLRFAPPVTHVYNPLDYAWAPHRKYIERFGATRKRALLLGMNPGPFGMAQTGVPFGDIPSVRDFLKIVEPVGKPAKEHPQRPILGFACQRGEVSGTRVWGLVRGLWGTPDAFFADFYVANYCPLVFVEEGGKNRTPDKLPASERNPLISACDRHLHRIVELLAPTWVIGVGGFAEKQARLALQGTPVKIGQILHPSPASPAANRGWATAATAQLAALGLTPQPPALSA